MTTTSDLEALFDCSVQTAPFLDTESVTRRAIGAIARLTHRLAAEPFPWSASEAIFGAASPGAVDALAAWSRKHGWLLTMAPGKEAETTELTVRVLPRAERL